MYEAKDFLSQSRHSKFISKSQYNNRFDSYIKEAAQKYEVDTDLIHAIISVESSYDPDAVSPKGAIGLMQLMPQTAKNYGVHDIFSVKENIEGGTRYLKHLLRRYDGNIELSVAAYNAGEAAVDKYNGVPPYKETRRYVEKIYRYYDKRGE